VKHSPPIIAIAFYFFCLFPGLYQNSALSETLIHKEEGENPGNTSERITILTSFPPEFYKPFVSRFKTLFPSFQIQVLNKKTTAALAEIQRGNSRNFDLFWASSTDAFEVLKLSGNLKQSQYKLKYPTLEIEGVNLDDHDGYFFGFALSSVGYMWNNRFLRENNLMEPSSWQTLADSSYYGSVAMSTPSRSGTTHLIVESILQGMGWQEGWAYLLKTAGNFATVTARSFSVPEGVVNGRFGIGLVIDFLAQGLKSMNADIEFQYGEPILLVPAGIGLLKGGGNTAGAKKFLDFILSPEGQEILLNPTIGRLPILKEIYAKDEINTPALLRFINQKKISPYDTELSTIRYHLVNTLFDQLITYRLLERRKIWKSLIQLEQKHGIDDEYLAKVKKDVLFFLTEIPVSEEQSIDSQVNLLLSSSPGLVSNNAGKRELLQEWDKFVSKRLKQANNFLTSAWESMPAIHE